MGATGGAPFAPVGPVFEALVEYLCKSVVMVRSDDGQGSGVIWTRDGLIITNDHVAHSDALEVDLSDGRRTKGAVVARDHVNDLAAIRTDVGELTPVTPGDSQALRVGQLILAVGHPLGVRDTATLGIVSGIGTRIRKGRYTCDVLQADVQLLPGNSGGLLADVTGRVIGIASMVLSPGIALAVPVHVVQEFVRAVDRRAEPAGRAAL